MGMIRRIVLLLFALTLTVPGFCQESDSKKINKIKRNSQYLYAEATMKDAEEAYEAAMELLNGYIDEYVQSKKKYNSSDNIIIKDLGSSSESLQMQRGELTRVFVYVKKSDIIPAENSTLRENAGKKEDPELVAEVGEEEQLEGDSSLKLEKAWQQALIDELFNCRTIIEAKSRLNYLRSEYKVKRVGTPDSCKDKANCYWVIGDESGNLVTVLGMGDSERVNFKTMQMDSLDNYQGLSAIWFTMSD